MDDLPDWWQREKQTRQKRILLLLICTLALIAYFYYESQRGRTGFKPGVVFDSTDYIAFVRQDKEGNSSLYAIRADGTDLRRLSDANDKSDKFSPTWTMDGKSVLYVSNRSDARVRQIFIQGEGDPVQLTYGSSSKDAPAVSPDRKRAAFVTQGAIKTVYLNGEDVYQELPRPRSGNSDNSDGATAPGEVEPRGPFLNAAFSADGRGIAGVQSLSGENPLNLSEIIPGEQVARVVPPGENRAYILDTGHDVSVAWDPNSSRLACAFSELLMSDKSGKETLIHGIRIWSFDTPGKPTTKQVFTSFGNSIMPRNLAWSPDGKMLAFEGWALKSPGERELRGIVVMRAIEANVVFNDKNMNLIQYIVPAGPQGKPQRPRWSPDSTRLLYEMQRPSGGSDLWVATSEGLNPVNLTKGEGNNTDGIWSPIHTR